MMTGLTIVEALEDPDLFGGLQAFRDLSTWKRWLVFLKAVDGLPLTDDEQEIFVQHTGRTRYDPPKGGYPETAAIMGRQSGKTIIAATLVAFEAATAPADGDELYSIMVAQDHRASLRGLFRYASLPFEQIPVLERDVVSKLASTITLKNGSVISAYPCRLTCPHG